MQHTLTVLLGGIILGYDGDIVWQTELIAMLLADRVGVIDDGSGDNTVERLVDNSLSMIKDESISLTFMALGVCPEDVLVVLPVAQLICGAEQQLAGKLNAVVMRRSIKALADRHLLQGGIASGVQMHDIVRDLVRSRMGGEGGIRAKQRNVVDAFVAACPAGGWAKDDAVGQYVALALETHMLEAVLPNLIDDEEAQAWLLHTEEIIVSNVATALGSAKLEGLSAAKEAAGDLVGGARVAWSARSVKQLPAATKNELVYRTAALLESADDPSCASFEKAVLHAAYTCDMTSERHAKGQSRLVVLAQASGAATFGSKMTEWLADWTAGFGAWGYFMKPWPCPMADVRSGTMAMRHGRLGS